MNTRTKPAKRISVFAHPMAVLVVVAMGIVLLAISIAYTRSSREAYVGLLAGLAESLPSILVLKWVLRRYKNFWAEYYTTPFVERQSWRSEKTNLLCMLPICLGILGNMALGWYFNVSEPIGASMFGALCILAYPEQKAIWLAAKARVAQSETTG